MKRLTLTPCCALAVALLAGAAHAQTLVNKTPKLHLSFDSVNGTTVLNSGFGGTALNGTLNGTASIVSGGRFGNCLSITGTDSTSASCRIANSVVPLNGTSPWTVAMWIQTTTPGGAYAYQGDGGWNSGNTTFYLNQGNGTAGNYAGGVRNSQNWVTGTNDLTGGAWHHIAVACDGSTRIVYVDGVQEATDNDWAGSGTGGQFWIGGTGSNEGDGQVNLNGLIDEAYVFDQTLSLSDIQGLFYSNSVPSVPVAVTVNPTYGYRGQTFTVTATASPAVGTVTNATINLSPIGLSATANLTQSSANVFTGTFTVPNNTNATIGAALLTATVISTQPLMGSGGATFTVVALPPTNALILTQLTGVSVHEYTKATFHFVATNDAPNQAPFPMTYAWYTNGVLVSTNPMGPYYSFLTVPANNGMSVQAVARVADTNFSSIAVTSAVVTLTVSSGSTEYAGLKQEIYPGATRQDVEIGNAGPGSVGMVTTADTAGGFGDNTSRRYSGYFIAPTTDDYVFFLASDDDCDLFLSSDTNPLNKQLIAQETSWSGTRAWQSGGSILSQKRSDQWTNSAGLTPYASGIALAAGQKYYIEAVMHNGGGGDNWAMTYQTKAELTADSTLPVDGSASRMTVESNNIAFVTFPGTSIAWGLQPTNLTVFEGDTARFFVNATSDSELDLVYQWYVNNAPYPGATGHTLAMPQISAAYNLASIYAVASTVKGGISTTSSVVTLTVNQAVWEPGFVKVERYNGVTRTQVENGSVSTPDYLMAVSAMTLGIDNPSGQDNFSRRISGYFIPPTSGNYVFYVCGDDDTDLFISTDDKPTTKRLVAQETAWSDLFYWSQTGNQWWHPNQDAGQKSSETWTNSTSGGVAPYASGIYLNAGTRYYIEMDFHQGSGGCHVEATYKLVGEANPADYVKETRLKGNAIGTKAIRCSYVAFTQQPANTSAPILGLASFSAAGTTDSTMPVGTVTGFEKTNNFLFFQWQKNGVDIPGATASTLTYGPVLPSDNGAQITCRMRALGYADNSLNRLWSNSTPATLTVTQQGVFEPGFAMIQWWTNNGVTRAAIEANSLGAPAHIYSTPKFEGPIYSSYDNFGSRVSGFFVPQTTGDYVFFMLSDDDGDLFLSTDSSPMNKRLIAQEAGWSGNANNWSTPGGGGDNVAQRRSDQYTDPLTGTQPYASGIHLIAGQKYYMEGVLHEGGYGDYFQATYKLTTDSDPADGTDSALSGNLIGAYVPRIPWMAFLQQPVGASVTSGRESVTFTAQGTNAPSIVLGTTGDPKPWFDAPTNYVIYQWYKNGNPIAGATRSSFTLPYAVPADNNAQFVCGIRALGYSDNSLNPIYSNSSPAILTVTPDSTLPLLSYAALVQNSIDDTNVTSLDVTFSERMDPTTLSNVLNYSISGVSITSVSVSPNGRTVRLLLSALPTLPLNIGVSGVKDVSGNTIAAGASTAIQADQLTFNDVGTPGTDPAYPSSFWRTGNGCYIVAAEGSDIWNAADGFNFGWEKKTNNFDVVVRGVSITPSSFWAKMGLMVRETLDAGSREWSIQNEPLAADGGANRIDTAMREAVGGTSANWQLGALPAPAYPNAWLRLARTGDVLDGYYSTDGGHWVHAASYNTATNANGALSAEVYVGICTTAHANDPVNTLPPYLYYNTSEYANYGPYVAPVILSINVSGANAIVSWSPAGGHLEASPAVSGPGVNWQTVTSSNPATIPLGAGERFFRVVTP